MKRCVLQPRRLIWAALIVLALPAMGQTVVFNCGSGSWNTSANPCLVSNSLYATAPNLFYASNGGTLVSSGNAQIVPASAGHNGWGFLYGQTVSDTMFSTHFTFIPNGFNLAFVVQNMWTCPPGGSGCSGPDFPWMAQSGAGNEAGFYQGAGGATGIMFNEWAIEFDSYGYLHGQDSSFTYSSAQMYQTGQLPGVPPQAIGGGYAPAYTTEKISTSPVPLNNPASTQGSASTDTFSATIVYTGTTVTLSLYDLTAGGSCPGASCFTYTWQGVNIPGISGNYPTVNNVGQAWVGFNAGTSLGTGPAEQLLTWSYETLSAAANPSCSPGGGSFGSTQSVTCSDSSSSSVMCYNTIGAPYTDGNGNCPNGTKYTGAISVPQGETLYVIAGAGSSTYGDSAVVPYTYSITGTAAKPTFNPPTGTYSGNQNVYLSVPPGQTAYYNTTGSPTCSSTAYSLPISVSSNETIYAVGCGSGLTTSPVTSSTYTLNLFLDSGPYTTAPANSPTASPVGGTYGSSQTVTLASSTASSYICYTVSSTLPSVLPQPSNYGAIGPSNGAGSCNTGTLYSAPISISASESIYAMAATPLLTLPSSMVAIPYTIGGTPTASTPTFSPVAGTYVGTQHITLSTTSSGAIICYNTTGAPATNGATGCANGTLYSGTVTVSSSETLYAVAGGTGYSDSSVGSAGYVVSSSAPAVIRGKAVINGKTVVQ